MLWPEYDETLVVDEMVTIAVQFKGKTRGTIEVGPDINEDGAMEIVKRTDFGAKYLSQGDVRKVIYIPNKIINIIIS